MGLGKRRGGSDFLPILKYDATHGTFYLQDRVNRGGIWENEQTDVTSSLVAIFDLECIQVGWIYFPKGAAPEMIMVPAGADRGEAPSKDHREGFRLIVKMDEELGGDVRELLSTAVAAWNGVDAIHTTFCEQTPKHPGQLPVVKISNIVKKKTASGFSFTPVFEIIDWVERPDDMPKPGASDQRRPMKAVPIAEDVIPF